MTRPAEPLLYLAEPAPAVRKSPGVVKISLFDHFVHFTIFLFLVGGSALLLDQASARATGHEAQAGHWFAHGWAALSTFGSLFGKYTALFGASLVSTALMVAMVQSLRLLDVMHCRNVAAALREKPGGGTQVTRAMARDGGYYMLAPVFE